MAILGPRQTGKTTLARSLLQTHGNALYLDLESPQDRTRLGEGPLFLQAHADRLIILDEVQHAPELFSVLRGEIDRARRPGRFVLLGSASFELLPAPSWTWWSRPGSDASALKSSSASRPRSAKGYGSRCKTCAPTKPISGHRFSSAGPLPKGSRRSRWVTLQAY